jgi:hypothetical protein
MAFRSGRHSLQIPGPTNLPDRVLRAMDQPLIDHRGPEFPAITKSVVAGLKRGARHQGRARAAKRDIDRHYLGGNAATAAAPAPAMATVLR